MLLAAAAAHLYLYQRLLPTPDELEHRRRRHIATIGRIAEGQVLELTEAENAEAKGPGNHRSRQLVFYSYTIAGVTYEAAQDVTTLVHRVRLERCLSGVTASIKYDPANPSNSVIISEEWSGLE
jgi:hypothetical protein